MTVILKRLILFYELCHPIGSGTLHDVHAEFDSDILLHYLVMNCNQYNTYRQMDRNLYI